MVSPSSRRRAVTHIVGEGLGSAAQACRAIGLARSSLYRASQASEQRRELQTQIIDLSQQHPRYGYRRVTALLRRGGKQVNAKRVQRVRRREGLQVRKKQRRMKRVGISTGQRQRAEHRNEVWSWDSVHDQTEMGSPFRILTLIDEYTKQSLATHVAWSIRALDAITVIEAAIERYGLPEHLRSDNGPEFIAYAIRDWMANNDIKTIYIKPGAPWEQPFIESFHDKLRDECLNREIFGSLLEARILIEQWRIEYNQRRPHSSLGYLTPAEFAEQQKFQTMQPRRHKDNRWALESRGFN
jgi:putative transposase